MKEWIVTYSTVKAYGGLDEQESYTSDCMVFCSFEEAREAFRNVVAEKAEMHGVLQKYEDFLAEEESYALFEMPSLIPCVKMLLSGEDCMDELRKLEGPSMNDEFIVDVHINAKQGLFSMKTPDYMTEEERYPLLKTNAVAMEEPKQDYFLWVEDELEPEAEYTRIHVNMYYREVE